MPKLDDKVKRFIVRALAHYDTPTEVARQVKEEFGLDIGRQQVQSYDPTKALGKSLAADLRKLFEETRASFVDEVEKVPIAQRAFRLRKLQTMLERAEARNNHALVATLLEQAAKEVGGLYTNARRVEASGPNGGAIPVRNDGLQPSELTDDELARLEEIRAAADARRNSAGVGTPSP